MTTILHPDHLYKDLKDPYPTTTVYSCYFPKVRAIVKRSMKEFDHSLLTQNIYPGLDAAHEELIGEYTKSAKEDHQAYGFETFAHNYFTNGSSEALFHLMAKEAQRKTPRPVYALRGEYQGYQAYAEAMRVPIELLTPDELLRAQKGLVFISNPSARDGNVLEGSLLKEILNRHQVILDLAYLGMSRPMNLDLTHPNIEAVCSSMSKPYGLYYFRIGFCFSRDEVLSLFGNRWFKNISSIKIGQAVLEELPFKNLREEMSRVQKEAISCAEEDLKLKRGILMPSDVFLLATASEHIPEFSRGGKSRLCLTPYFYRSLEER